MRRMIFSLMLVLAVSAFGQVPTYDGVDQYVGVDSPVGLTTATGSISLWVKTTNTTDTTYAGSISNTGSTFNYISLVRTGAGKATFQVRYNNVLNDLRTTFSIADGVWHHVVFVCDGSVYRCYVDGLERAITAFQGADDGKWLDDFSIPPNNLTMGALVRATMSNFFDGSEDDVRIYNTPLTSNDVARLTLDTCEMYRPDFWTNATLHATQTTWETGYGNTNLVGAWRGDRTPYGNGQTVQEVRDVSGEGNHGTREPTQTTGPTYIGKVDGRRGVYELDGANDYVGVADADSLSPSYVTVMTWVNLDTAGANEGIFAKGDSSHREYWLWISSPSTTIAASAAGNTGHPMMATPNTGEWHHYALRYDGATMDLFFDGVLTNSVVKVAGPIENDDNGLEIGRLPGFGYMDGKQDDFRIYPTALTATQILAIYNGIQPTNAAVLNMPFDYKDDQMPDISDNGNNGLFYNQPTIEGAR